MSRPARWALSPLDDSAHLLGDEGHDAPEVLTARCGHQLSTTPEAVHHRPGPACTRCALIFLALGGVVLSVDDHLHWLALLRVRAGEVTKLGQDYLYRGQPFPAASLVGPLPLISARARLRRSRVRSGVIRGYLGDC